MQSKAQHWDTTEQGDHFSHSPTKPASQQTYLASFMSKDSVVEQPQPYAAAAAASLTAVSTRFSVPASSSIDPAAAGARESKTRRRKLKFNGFGIDSILKLRRKPVSEARLHKKLKKRAEKGDWDAVRKLISGREFSDVDPRDQRRARQNRKRVGGVVFPAENPSPKDPMTTSAVRRRSSYRSGNRRSFSGGESAAAAAVIQAALMEERSESGSSDRDLCGEEETAGSRYRDGSILHDACRHRPPSDVVETLLAALRRRRRGRTTSGRDREGRTPLHLAAATGASSEVVDALVRADPEAASAADDQGRSPLHLAAMRLTASTDDDDASCLRVKGSERTLLLETVMILKETMLGHPGGVDFRDEDATGRSPLDYAIECGFAPEELIRALLRRKEPKAASRRNRRTGVTLSNRRRPTASQCGSDDDQDLEVLRQLERDEIDARRRHVEKLKARAGPKGDANDVLFDAFGIDERAAERPASTTREESVDERVGDCGPDAQRLRAAQPTDADIYHRHLLDYLDDFAGGVEGCEDLEYDHYDENEFDIYEDPSQARIDEALARGDSALLTRGRNERLPSSVVFAEEDDDCCSLVSEITAPWFR